MEISETELILMKESLGIVTDRRRRGWHFLHNLVDILVIGLSAALCGWTEFEQMEELGLEREDFFKRFLELPNEPSDRRSVDLWSAVRGYRMPTRFTVRFRWWSPRNC
jgi:hypothetical protein